MRTEELWTLDTLIFGISVYVQENRLGRDPSLKAKFAYVFLSSDPEPEGD